MGDTSDEDLSLEDAIMDKKQDIASVERQLTRAKTTYARDSLVHEIADMKVELQTLQAKLDKLRGVGGKRRRARKTRKVKKVHKKRTMKHRR
jgi:septal ring factor EnvC (AmiA/AmiB activator)